MSFIASSKLNSREDEMNHLAKARGFGPGDFIFEPNSYDINLVTGGDTSILNGTMKGTFIVPEDDIKSEISFDKSNFPDKTWAKICSCLGFKYHNHSDIISFKLETMDMSLNLSIETPKEDN